MQINWRDALFIDGSHCDRLKSALDCRIDLEKIRHLAACGEGLVYSGYYRDVRDPEEAARQGPLLTWLSHHGFDVKGRTVEDLAGLPRERYGTNLVEMAVDALRISQVAERIALVAADAKLVPLVLALRKGGQKVTVLSTSRGPASIVVAPQLRNVADRFIDLSEHVASISMPAE
ncbi:NYN domain-containing protein [Ancylobacter sp. TS-1]|uniref:NYN domain-containing protein n=1 Tax=Ancylobacter sp. TS-1 TaxID=1850374 RepID=UPI001265B1C5|nr:NYN domain-containing protein [Ancylobacter sp. TS-1]QFR34688.1 NYN domain-containing protein [Ancylobacter sp. TS-1]